MTKRLTISVHIARDALRLPELRVLGEWDPLLRRISIFDTSRGDRELVESLLHELAHAAGEQDEQCATTAARLRLASLTDGEIGEIATVLRESAGRSVPLESLPGALA